MSQKTEFFYSSLQEHKVLLTGTPLQNTVEELFSLLHFLEPARFPSESTFMQEFGDLKTEEQVSMEIHHQYTKALTCTQKGSFSLAPSCGKILSSFSQI